MGQRQVAARRQRVEHTAGDDVRPVLIGDEVHDRDEQHNDRVAEIERCPQRGGGQDAARVAQVSVDVGGLPRGATGEQCPRVGEHDGVVVHVADPSLRNDALSDLVHVGWSWQSGADVKELPAARLGGQVTNDPSQEGTVLPGPDPGVRPCSQDLVGRRAVGREIILTAERVVIDPGRVGAIGLQVDCRPLIVRSWLPQVRAALMLSGYLAVASNLRLGGNQPSQSWVGRAGAWDRGRSRRRAGRRREAPARFSSGQRTAAPGHRRGSRSSPARW
jgi:hypothetical protein